MSDSPLLIIRAHQYLYYVKGRPALSDYEYDLMCKKLGFDGGGGSDCEEDYTPEEIAYAEKLER